MPLPEEDPEDLLRRAAAGEDAARERLLARHRDRLRHVVELCLHRGLAARIDPSAIVEAAMADAIDKLPEYLEQRLLPFYPWLLKLALKRVIEMHPRHIQAQKRSVLREEQSLLPTDESTLAPVEDV